MTEDRIEPDEKKDREKDQKPATLRYYYIKSNSYHTIPIDGCFGGRQPRGQFQISFFYERLPIPQIVEHQIKDTRGSMAKIGDEISRVTKEGVIREVEVGVTMSVEVARIIHVWLGEQLSIIDEENKKIKEMELPNGG